MHIYIHIRVRVCVRMHIPNMYIYTYICVFVHLCVCARKKKYIYTYVPMYIYVYIYINSKDRWFVCLLIDSTVLHISYHQISSYVTICIDAKCMCALPCFTSQKHVRFRWCSALLAVPTGPHGLGSWAWATQRWSRKKVSASWRSNQSAYKEGSSIC